MVSLSFFCFSFVLKHSLSHLHFGLINLFNISISHTILCSNSLVYSDAGTTAAGAGAGTVDVTESKIEVFLDIDADLDSLEGRAFEIIQVINVVLNFINAVRS